MVVVAVVFDCWLMVGGCWLSVVVVVSCCSCCGCRLPVVGCFGCFGC